jgi:hypothetical protein
MNRVAGDTPMRNSSRSLAPEQKLARIQLVARVQLAYEQLVDAVQRYGWNPSRRKRIHDARRRLAALNFALALLSLQS